MRTLTKTNRLPALQGMNPMHKKWLYRLILSYLPILFAVVFCLIILFFLTLNETIEKQTAQANEVYAENVMQIVDTTLRNIETPMIKSLLLNDKVERYFSSQGGHDPYGDYGVTEVLLDFMSPLPMIDSVYLYREADGKVLMQHFSSSLPVFGDKAFIEASMPGTAPYAWSGLRGLHLFAGEEQPKSVISLVKLVPYFSGEQGLIVVNVRKESLQALIQDMNQANTEVCLKDAEGRSFGGSEACADPEGPAPGAVSLTSAYTGWTVQVGMARQGMFSLLSSFSNLWALLGFVAIIGGIAAMTYISHRHYRPLGEVMSRIHTFGEKNSPAWLPQAKDGDEFSFIGHALENLIEQTNSYEKQQEEGMLYLRSHFFKQLLESSEDISTEQWTREARRMGLSGEFEQAVAGVVEIDFYESFTTEYSPRDQSLFKFTLRSVMEEIADREGESLWTEWVGPSRLGLLYRSAGEYTGPAVPEKVLAMAESARVWVKDHMKFTVTFGFGGQVSGLRGLSGSYRQALESLDRKITDGPNRVYVPAAEDAARPPAEGMDVLVQAIRDAAQLYRLGNADWEPMMERMFALMASGSYSKEDIVRLLQLLESQLAKEMQELPQPMREMWDSGGLRGIPRSAEAFEWIEELRAPLMDSLREMEERVRELRMNREHYNLANRVREFVAEHYANPDFSLTHVSETFEMNTKTLSRIFKEELGENFVDYLARLRMEEAKRLLRETDEPVQSVAEKVGYLYPMSFIRVFKRLENMTPGEYRKERDG